MTKLTIYATQTCVWCKAVEKLFTMKHIDYEKVYIDDKPQLSQELYEKTGQMTVPVTSNGTDYVVGYNVGKLLALV